MTITRRNLLHLSLGASLFLGTASLAGCSGDKPANGFHTLRDSDLPLLRAIIPVIVAADPALVLPRLDQSLSALSPAMLKVTRQLFDVLALAATRGPLTGIWGRWENAEPVQIEHFLRRWENSSLNLLRQGHAALLQLVQMAWYSLPESWASCGYPGPPKL